MHNINHKSEMWAFKKYLLIHFQMLPQINTRNFALKTKTCK